jgi:hypothetical protein
MEAVLFLEHSQNNTGYHNIEAVSFLKYSQKNSVLGKALGERNVRILKIKSYLR